MTTQPQGPSPTRTRMILSGIALTAVVLDVGIKTVAERALNNGRTIDLPILDLQLSFNPGVAFGAGSHLPAAWVLTLTITVATLLALFALHAAPTLTRPAQIALAVVLAGAAGNVIDRARDGVVTDYLHTGWFPTFNLADIFITLGVAVVVITGIINPDRQLASDQ